MRSRGARQSNAARNRCLASAVIAEVSGSVSRSSLERVSIRSVLVSSSAWTSVLSVVAAQLVEHRAVDAGPGELLERRPLFGVVTVDRADQGLEAA